MLRGIMTPTLPLTCVILGLLAGPLASPGWAQDAGQQESEESDDTYDQQGRQAQAVNPVLSGFEYMHNWGAFRSNGER